MNKEIKIDVPHYDLEKTVYFDGENGLYPDDTEGMFQTMLYYGMLQKHLESVLTIPSACMVKHINRYVNDTHIIYLYYRITYLPNGKYDSRDFIKMCIYKRKE